MNTITLAKTLLALVAILMTLSVTDLPAQIRPTPRRSMQMLQTAEEYARTNLPSDAVLAIVGAIGNVEVGPGIGLTIDADNGTATAWAYQYYTATHGQWYSIAVIDLGIMGEQVFESDPPTEIPASLAHAVDLSREYAESGAMSERLSNDGNYQTYREQYPGVKPSMAAYRNPAAADSALLPATFPLDAPLWTVEFSGRGDSAMTCWVSSRTGETVCVRMQAADVREALQHSAEADVTPNPASDIVTITLKEASGENVALFDVNGARVALPLRIDGGGVTVVFDVSALAPGTYFMRSDRGAAIRVMVARGD